MFKKVKYSELNSRQKENYNFHKISSALADYGYNCMWLNDDWQGADFIACHIDGNTFLKIQLKGRLTIDKKYLNKDIHIAFRQKDDIYIYPHDTLVEIILKEGLVEDTESWKKDDGGYSWPTLSKKNKEILAPFKL